MVSVIATVENKSRGTQPPSAAIAPACTFHSACCGLSMLTSVFTDINQAMGPHLSFHVILPCPKRGVWEPQVRLSVKTDSFPSSTDTTCVKSCPEGYHTDKDSGRCVPCHYSCQTCEGPHSMQCHSCRPGWFQLGKECLLQCRDG